MRSTRCFRSQQSTAAKSRRRMLIFFDLDNTLYRYDHTTIETDWISKTATELGRIFPDRTSQELKDMDTRYHSQYGMIPTGLAHDYPATFDPVKFVKDTHVFQYDGVVPCSKTQDILAKLDGLGHNLWIFTNGDMPHIESVLRHMDIRTYFTKKGCGVGGDENNAGDVSSSAALSGAAGVADTLKCIDVFTQWKGVPNEKLFNKPMQEAYTKALAIVANTELSPSAMSVDEDDDDDDDNPQRYVMIEDSFANLVAPAKMGWKTVWISYGRPLPTTALGTSGEFFTPTCVIDSLLQLEEATFLFQPMLD